MNIILSNFLFMVVVFVSVFSLTIATGRQYYWISILAWLVALAPTCIALAPTLSPSFFGWFVALLVLLIVFVFSSVFGPLFGIAAITSSLIEKLDYFPSIPNETLGVILVVIAAVAGNVTGFMVVEQRTQPQEEKEMAGS